MAGVTFSQPGNWTSWPPHEHAALAEEGVAYGLSLEYPPPLCYILAYAACPIAIWSGNAPAVKRYVELLLVQSASLSFGSSQQIRGIATLAAQRRVESRQCARAMEAAGDFNRRPSRCGHLPATEARERRAFSPM